MTAYSSAQCLSPSALFAAMLVAAVTSAQASVQISSNPTHNMNCSGGVCTPTAKNADLNATDLANMLAGGDVKVVTGAGAVTITVSQSFSWTSSHRLTLDAHDTVSFRAPVEVAGQGAVTIVTNDGGTDGDLIFFEGGKLDFWDTKSRLVINRNHYALMRDIATLANAVSANPSGSYALGQDYDASADGTYGASPVATQFSGAFEGLGHTIANLKIHIAGKSPPVLIGLFASLVEGSIVRDLNLSAADMSDTTDLYAEIGAIAATNVGTLVHVAATGTLAGGNSALVGGLTGWNLYIIAKSHASVSIAGQGNSSTGGLAGLNYGEIADSYAYGAVTGAYHAGGVTGDSWGYVRHCSAGGKITGQTAGGLVGWNRGSVENSSATAEVSGKGAAGGLVGFTQNNAIASSFATGPVQGSGSVGGLVGINKHFAEISNSYATGSVSGSQNAVVGGLIGSDKLHLAIVAVSNSYSTGAVGGDAAKFLGGVVGFDASVMGNIATVYWDLDTSGISDPSQGAGNIANDPGITGLTDAQLKSGLLAGFDPNIWGLKPNINNGYPYLLANPPPQ